LSGIIDCIAKAWIAVGLASSPRIALTERSRPGRRGGEVKSEEEGALEWFGGERSNSEPRSAWDDTDSCFNLEGAIFWMEGD
jgi:hypothetical protein